jgi:hypothetical protein
LSFALNRIKDPRDGLMRRETPQPGATPESSFARLKPGGATFFFFTKSLAFRRLSARQWLKNRQTGTLAPNGGTGNVAFRGRFNRGVGLFA